jgi:hypothetical protein
MFARTPPQFHDVASRIMDQLGFTFSNIDLGNVWLVFHHISPFIQEEFVPQTNTSDSSGESSENDF